VRNHRWRELKPRRIERRHGGRDGSAVVAPRARAYRGTARCRAGSGWGANLIQGFFGKIPARGDFVRAGLPGGFVDPWDRWLQIVLAASQDRLGDRWRPAWLEAPVWLFALAPGVAGPLSALGAMLPSVDSHERYFPLTLARIGGDAIDATFLAAAESAGRDAIADDLDPQAIAARLAEYARASQTPMRPEPMPRDGTLWWTEGAPRRSPVCLTLADLPDGATFTAMLDETAAR